MADLQTDKPEASVPAAQNETPKPEVVKPAEDVHMRPPLATLYDRRPVIRGR